MVGDVGLAASHGLDEFRDALIPNQQRFQETQSGCIPERFQHMGALHLSESGPSHG